VKLSHEWTVAIRPAAGAKPRKITKIAGLEGGGFSIFVPYHKAQTGYLFKHPVIPGVREPRFVAWDGGTVFTAHDRVKLNYHSDGFADFSGDIPGRITSSRDLVSGEAKGLGLFSAPLSRPIFSAPTSMVTAYGLDQFETAKEQDGLIIFGPEDFYYRKCTPESANLWILSVYAFPRNTIPPLRFKQQRSTLQVTIEPLNGPIASIMELVAISLPEDRIFLGLCVNCWKAQLQSESGWILQGPGDYTPDHRGHVLMGIYPRTEIPLTREMSFDRKPNSPTTDLADLLDSELAPLDSPPPRTKKNRRRS
jgi:hypothetical protein